MVGKADIRNPGKRENRTTVRMFPTLPEAIRRTLAASLFRDVPSTLGKCGTWPGRRP